MNEQSINQDNVYAFSQDNVYAFSQDNVYAFSSAENIYGETLNAGAIKSLLKKMLEGSDGFMTHNDVLYKIFDNILITIKARPYEEVERLHIVRRPSFPFFKIVASVRRSFEMEYDVEICKGKDVVSTQYKHCYGMTEGDSFMLAGFIGAMKTEIEA